MSNYYLCPYCAHDSKRTRLVNGIACPSWRCVMGETEPRVMVDHHGIGGRRYDEPKDVCKHYEPKEEA